jgi:formate-dependent nitrite reductase cytochrome c552 subunit
MNTQRIEKLKEYFSDDRFSGFIEEIIEAKVLKYQDILKYWLLFSGKKKD